MLPLQWHLQMVRNFRLKDKDDKSQVPSPASSVLHSHHGTLKNLSSCRKEHDMEFPVWWSGLVLRVGASHRVNLITPFPYLNRIVREKWVWVWVWVWVWIGQLHDDIISLKQPGSYHRNVFSYFPGKRWMLSWYSSRQQKHPQFLKTKLELLLLWILPYYCRVIPLFKQSSQTNY